MSNLHTLSQLQSGYLGPLKRIQLAEGLTQFPDEIFQYADSLEILDLSNNQLSSLPENFEQLSQLKILFLSFNQFDHIPEVIGRCPKLEMIGFKANHISTVAEHVFPVDTRWLILTENNIETLPDSMGELHRLQKCALAGNALTALPESMKQCKNLELLRLSANQLTQIPDWLFQLPKLTWLAFAGNQFNQAHAVPESVMTKVSMADIHLIEQIGEGASGIIHRANAPRSLQNNEDQAIAVKLFKGEITSDGYPLDELANCIQAKEHENLIQVLAQIDEPDQLGLVMSLIPNEFKNLGLPPNFITCTRDTFAEGTQFTYTQVFDIALAMANTLAHLHKNKVSHGDIYAHNVMIKSEQSSKKTQVLFGDFGAASNLNALPIEQVEAMQAIEVRAFGCLLEDLLNLVDNKTSKGVMELKQLSQNCLQANMALRPTFCDLVSVLNDTALVER